MQPTIAWTCLGMLLVAFAFRAIASDPMGVPESHAAEAWFFAHDAKSPLLALGVGLWLLYRRLTGLPRPLRMSAPWTTLLLLAVGVALFVASQLLGAQRLLIASLSAHALALACALSGHAGLRQAWLPAFAILLGAELPASIQGALLWSLQNWTTEASGFLLEHWSRDEVVTSGVTLFIGERAFLVIEACSGLRGIEILCTLSLVIREFFRSAGARVWLVVLAAPFLAFALNLARVCLIAAGPSRESDPGHVSQGVGVVVVGVIGLFALARAIAGRAQDAEATAKSPPWPARFGIAFCAWGALLAGLSLVPASPLPQTRVLPPLAFPERTAGWQLEEEVKPDRLFLGSLPLSQIIERRYVKEPRLTPPARVDVLIATRDTGRPGDALVSAKLAVPGREWSLRSSKTARLWAAGIDGKLTTSERPGELALSFSFQVGGFPEADSHWTRWLGVPSLGPEPPLYFVRLSAPLAATGHVARQRTRALIERFATDFSEAFQDLQTSSSEAPDSKRTE